MHEQHQHVLTVLDFIPTNQQSIFVKIAGYDAVLGKEFKGEVKFLNGMPFGDLIHPERSSLSSECREFVREELVTRYTKGQFA
jgi:hypothetical protein